MRNILLPVAATMALAVTSAQAADMPTKAYNAATPAKASGWQGFYLGVHGGYSWNQIRSALAEEEFDIGKIKPDSFLVGGQAGYNWQFGAIVPGVEVDITYAGKSDDILEGAVAGKVKYLGSARARLGVAFSDGFMAYGTAGLGWANSQLTIVETATSSTNHFGWVGGVGLELKLFTNNWIGRLEYLHYDLGGSSYFGVIDASLKQDVVRAALSYRFAH